ncbi:hypothetical protein [Nocardioides sp.]|uniref:hypothetical protein n=1 Tax=Nocardioides sp. TaxID=35761 RepID=UPI003783CC80
MRAYRICWTVAVALLAAAAAFGAATDATPGAGWRALAVTAACSAVLGGMVGVVWAEEAGRRMVLRCSAWAVVGGLLVVGLPALLGAWSLVVLTVVVLTAPPLVAAVRDLLHARGERWEPSEPAGRSGPLGSSDPEAEATTSPTAVSLMTDRELERRWHLTSARLRHPGTPPEAAMVLVAERVHLLDEIERRNPEHFAAILDRTIGLEDGGPGTGLGDNGREGGTSG